MCECRDCAGKPTYSEAFRHETEVRYIIRLQNSYERTLYLGKVAEVRGKQTAQILRQDAWNAMCKKVAA